MTIQGGGDGLSIGGRSGDNFDMMWEGCKDDGLPSYFGTTVDCCIYYWLPVDKEEVLKERRLRNWVVPIYVICLAYPEQWPCQGCRES